MNYSEIVEALSELTVVPSDDTNLLAILPYAFAYAEGRIYRELDMLAAMVRDSSVSTVALDRNLTMPTAFGTFQVVDAVNVITPAGVAVASGTRNPLRPVSRDFLDMVWPSTTGAAVPQFYHYFSQDTSTSQPGLIFGPWPDAAYRVEVVGRIQPAVLSAANPSNFLTANLSDLYIAACMIFLAGGWQKNFGAQGDDPRSAQSWETQYGLLRDSAATWEARKRFGGASWTSKAVEPTAQAQRG